MKSDSLQQSSKGDPVQKRNTGQSHRASDGGDYDGRADPRANSALLLLPHLGVSLSIGNSALTLPRRLLEECGGQTGKSTPVSAGVPAYLRLHFPGF